MSSKRTKKTIIEGWLKKLKEHAKIKMFGSAMNKRYFALDIVNATFTYSTGKNSKPSAVIPLRDIIDLKNILEPEIAKEWQFMFKVMTREREYQLFAQTKAEKEMWVHAFSTILKYKNKAADIKKQESERPSNKQLEIGMENEGFDASEEDSNEENKQSHGSRSPQRNGDFMEANPRQLQVRKELSQKSDSDISTGRDNERNQVVDDIDEDSDDDKANRKSFQDKEDEEEYPKSVAKQTSLKDKKIISKKKIKSTRSSVEKKREQTSSERQNENKQKLRDKLLESENKLNEEVKKRMMPTGSKRRHSPEIIEDDSPRSIDDEPKIEEAKQNIRRKKSNDYDIDMKNTSTQQHNHRDNSDNDDEIDIDKIIKRTGPKETIQLEMPSLNDEGISKETLPYFNGFLNPLISKERQKNAEKPIKAKPMIKVKNIVKMDKNEDLLARWDKKYGQTSRPETKDDWADDSNQPKLATLRMDKFKSQEVNNKYVENVLANQKMSNGEEFEENWDEEDGSPIKAGTDHNSFQKVNKENKEYRRPDIVPAQTSKTKKKKKSKKTKVNTEVIQSDPFAHPKPINDGDFDLNWDE